MSEQILKEILQEIKKTNKRMDSMEEHMGSMEERMGSIEERMGSMEESMGSMQSTLKEHTGLLHALEHRVEENTAQLMAIAERLPYIEGDIASLKEEAERQSDYLEILTVRSAKQDTDIYRLKKATILKHIFEAPETEKPKKTAVAKKVAGSKKSAGTSKAKAVK